MLDNCPCSGRRRTDARDHRNREPGVRSKRYRLPTRTRNSDCNYTVRKRDDLSYMGTKLNTAFFSRSRGKGRAQQSGPPRRRISPRGRKATKSNYEERLATGKRLDVGAAVWIILGLSVVCWFLLAWI